MEEYKNRNETLFLQYLKVLDQEELHKSSDVCEGSLNEKTPFHKSCIFDCSMDWKI